MAEEPQAAWTHFDDAPEGAKLQDRFANYWKPMQEFGADGLDMSVIELAPGEYGPYHYHEGTVEEYYVVLDGELTLVLPDETVVGGPKTVFYSPPDAPHRPRNESDDHVQFLSMRTGEGGRTILED